MKGGMYQPVNYAADALAGFKGVQDIFSQQAQDERLKQQMDVEQERLAMQRETHDLDVRKKGLEVDDAEKNAAETQAFRDAVKQRAMSAIVPTKDPVQIKGLIASVGKLGETGDVLKGLLVDLKNPDIPLGNPVQVSPAMIDGTNIPAMAAPATGAVAAMAPQTDQAGVTHWRIPAAFAPEQFTQFDQAARLAYPGRFDVVHDDGQGGKYRLGAPNAVNLTSDGRMSVDYQTIDEATGQVIPGKVAPITDGKSNSPDDPVRHVNIDEYQKNLAFKNSVYQLALDQNISTTEAADWLVNRLLPAKSQEKIAESKILKSNDTGEHLKQKQGEIDIKAQSDDKERKRVAGLDQKVADAMALVKLNPHSSKFSVDSALRDIRSFAGGEYDTDGKISDIINDPEAMKVLREKITTADTEYRTRADHEQKRKLQDAQIGNYEALAQEHRENRKAALKDVSLTNRDKAWLTNSKASHDRATKNHDLLLKAYYDSIGDPAAKAELKVEVDKAAEKVRQIESEEKNYWDSLGKPVNKVSNLQMMKSHGSGATSGMTQQQTVVQPKPAMAEQQPGVLTYVRDVNGKLVRAQ